MNDFRQSRDHDKRIYERVSRPGLIGKLVCNNIVTIFEGFSHFYPVFDEKVSHSMSVSPERPKCFSNSIREVKLSPRMLSTIFNLRIPVLVKLKGLHVQRSWKSFGNFMGNSPNWHSICAKLLAEKILMKLYQGINPILR